MSGLASVRGKGSAALRVALLAAMMILAAGTSQADPDGGRGSGRGGRTHNGGGDRSYDGGGDRDHNGGGGRTYSNGGDRRFKGGGDRTYGGGGRPYIGGGGRACGDRGGPVYGGGGRYYGGGRNYHGGGRYCGPYGDRYIRPRTFVSFGIGLGLPYDCPPAYRYHVDRYPVEVESGLSIDVTNDPPAGCYYYDRYCDRQFSNLDDYTVHLERQNHAMMIEIIRMDSGDGLRTLEFVDGYWRVMR